MEFAALIIILASCSVHPAPGTWSCVWAGQTECRKLQIFAPGTDQTVSFKPLPLDLPFFDPAARIHRRTRHPADPQSPSPPL